VYPDANSTLRITYGTVDGYAPADGLYKGPFTTLQGISAKHTGKTLFDAPPAHSCRRSRSGALALRGADFGHRAGQLPVVCGHHGRQLGFRCHERSRRTAGLELRQHV
jgi:hypothetical protein